MTSSEVWTAQDADEYDERYADRYTPEVLGPSLDRLGALAGGGPVLELAIGTGRIGVGLHERGLDVVAYAHVDDPASLRVLEKAGLRRELYAKQSLWDAVEGWVDEVGYGLLADEWRAEQRVLRTQRLVLRPWREHDVDFPLDLYGREDAAGTTALPPGAASHFGIHGGIVGA